MLLRLLDRLNRSHPWSHNDAYAPFVVLAARRVRRAGGTSALDVGCGTGKLVALLARELPSVTGLEADKTTADLAAAATSHLCAVGIEHGSFPEDLDRRFDLVSMVAVLHHLPLTEGVRAARRAVAPGGRLVVIGAYRETRRDWPLSFLSFALNPLIGVVVHPRPARRLPQHMTAPLAPASDDFRRIASVFRAELPGVSIHRGMFWRYIVSWQAPQDHEDCHSGVGEER